MWVFGCKYVYKYIQCPQKSEEGIVSSGAGVWIVMRDHVTENLTQHLEE